MNIITKISILLTLCQLVKAIYYSNGIRNDLSSNLIPDFEITEDALLTTPELINKYGYPVEIHSVTTEDGYILTLHRIPYNPKFKSANDTPAVLHLHGFLGNSAEPIIAGPGNSLALFLSDTGYDVWIGNTRGSRYSSHVSLSTKDNQFWDYSWAEIGYYDTAAMIDYIIEITGQNKIFYSGYSRGTTASYVLCSERTEYNDKLKAIISLSPIAYMSEVGNPYFQLLSKNYRSLVNLAQSLGIYVLGADLRIFANIGQKFCSQFAPTLPTCELIFYSNAGFDYNYFNTSIIPAWLGHFPDAASVKETSHFAQTIVTGKFRKYDYGHRRNLIVYNSVVPPSYNLTKITAPVALFYSDNDLISPLAGAEQIYRELGNPIDKFLLPQRPNHFSYNIGINMREVYYEKVLDIFRRY